MDWMWCALHLEDGTRLHAVSIRLPGVPETIAVGYTQQPGTALVELTAVAIDTDFGDDGLPRSARLTLEPAGSAGRIDIVAHAPVALVADDGRIAQFPRAWVDITLDDGRRGTGWMEWNRNR